LAFIILNTFVYPPGVEGFEVLFEAEADATRNADP
jgi:hypothetical protein